MDIVIGLQFEYAFASHRIIEINEKTVITKRLDEFAKEQRVTWDREGLQFIFDNAEYHGVIKLKN